MHRWVACSIRAIRLRWGPGQLTGHLLAGAIYNALAQAVPNKVIAECGSAPDRARCVQRRRSPGPYRRFPRSCSPAAAWAQGPDRTGFPAPPSQPIRALAASNRSKQYRRSSSGASNCVPTPAAPDEFRGGLGQEVEVEVVSPEPVHLSLLSDRQKHAAQGSLGGLPGALVEISFADGTRPHPKSRTTLKPGDRLIMRYSGGGGYGDPANRGKAAVADDVREGLISAAGARNYAR